MGNPSFTWLKNRHQIPVRLFSSPQVPVEQKAVEELNGFLDLQDTLARIQDKEPDFFGGLDPEISQVAITPDFHKGAGIPIGTVALSQGFAIPQAIGRDVNCGMRLMLTDCSEAELRQHLPALEKKFRHVFFEGGRGISLDKIQREAILREGLTGLLETASRREKKNIWQHFDAQQSAKSLDRVIDQGSLKSEEVFSGLENYLGQEEVSFDGQIGSIGGGNHFVEFQRIDQILDGARAHAWGLKKDAVVVMIHSGSVSIGYPTSGHILQMLKGIYPKNLAQPSNGIYPMPLAGKHEKVQFQFQIAQRNAANFAFANRFFLALMAQKVISEVVGERSFELLYDSGHNISRSVEIEDESYQLHRKGACPVKNAVQMGNSPFDWTGEPGLIPGSMGSSSFVVAGTGNQQNLWSASHGAGRGMSRGKAMRFDDRHFEEFMECFKIITPISAELMKARPDILHKWRDDIKQEAPWAFKAIGPVIEAQAKAGIIQPVCRNEPLFTIKG